MLYDKLEEIVRLMRPAMEIRKLFELACNIHSEEELLPFRDALERTLDNDMRAVILTALAIAYRNLGDIEKSWSCSEEAFQLDPANEEARIDRAYGLLVQDRYEEGFAEYELRVGKEQHELLYPGKPLWKGEANRSRIIVTGEQGHGDQIMMSRFLEWEPLAPHRLFVECHPGLMPLFSRLGHIERVLPFNADPPIEEQREHLPIPANEVDFQIQFMSLAHAVSARCSSDLFRRPYLMADPNLNGWRDRLGGQGLKVGIVWRGDAGQARDHYRSIPLEQLRPLFEIRQARFFSLTREPVGRQELRDAGIPNIVDLSDWLTDFDQTAAAVANLCLVISVDTAVAHLAGALGKEVWVPLSRSLEWRWGITGEKTHWYPSMTLVRQERLNDWQPVIQRLRDMLEARLAKGRR